MFAWIKQLWKKFWGPDDDFTCPAGCGFEGIDEIDLKTHIHTRHSPFPTPAPKTSAKDFTPYDSFAVHTKDHTHIVRPPKKHATADDEDTDEGINVGALIGAVGLGMDPEVQTAEIPAFKGFGGGASGGAGAGGQWDEPSAPQAASPDPPKIDWVDNRWEADASVETRTDPPENTQTDSPTDSPSDSPSDSPDTDTSSSDA